VPAFKVVLLEHGYGNTRPERAVIEAAGGEFIDADPLPREEALRLAAEAEVILVRWLPITPEIIQGFRRCRIIIRYGIGYDNVDVPAATAAGIMVGHIPAYSLDEVSNHALALWLACVRNLTRTHDKMRAGGWDMNPPETVFRTAGKTFGLLSLGSIAQTVARKLSGWGMRLIATDPYVDPERARELGVQLVDFDTLCRESDYLSLHPPLLPETRRLIDGRAFGLMKRGVILVNTGRGPVVDGEALLAALNEGRVARAGFDVFEIEPLAVDSPLRAHPHLIVTDHVAWYSEESELELKVTAAEEAVRVGLGGLPKAIANPEVLHKLGRWNEWTPTYNARWQLARVEKLRATPSAVSGAAPA
jgi:D-3-phosphoglycerate dehydrogenase